MLGIDHAAARYTWTAAVVVLAILLVYEIRATLFLFIVAVLFAYLLSPLVNLLDRMLPGKRTRTPALLIAYLLVIGVLVWVGIELGSRVGEQANALLARIPEFVERAKQMTPKAGSLMGGIVATLQLQFEEHAKDIVGLLPAVGRRIISAAESLIIVIVVPILSFFFLKDAKAIRESFLQFAGDGPQRAMLRDIARDINLLLAQYVRALTLLCMATLIFFTSFFALTGVPYGQLLAAIAAVLEFIPVVGPMTAAALVLLVALVSGYPHILWLVIFLVVFRLLQDYVLSPRLMSSGMELHPLLVIFGIFAGGEIGGIAGTFLSVPVLALARILYRQIPKDRAQHS
jgi:predicted PurR-regulated permease PerM